MKAATIITLTYDNKIKESSTYMLKDNIKKIRESKHISQRALARQIGMSSQMISKIERGETSPSLETLNKIAAAFEMTLNKLIENKASSVEDLFRNIEDLASLCYLVKSIERNEANKEELKVIVSTDFGKGNRIHHHILVNRKVEINVKEIWENGLSSIDYIDNDHYRDAIRYIMG